MKVLTFNVRQWSRDLDKSNKFYWRKRSLKISKFIKEQDPDIIFFQELTFPMTKFIPDNYKKATGLSISHHIYCRKEYTVVNYEWHIHWCRALIKTDDNFMYNVFSVHSHWDENKYTKIAKQIRKNINKQSSVINIVGGDWNVNPNTMKKLLRPLTLVTSGEVTFHNYKHPEQCDELDYFGVYSTSYKITIKCAINVYEYDMSDHYPVVLLMTK